MIHPMEDLVKNKVVEDCPLISYEASLALIQGLEESQSKFTSIGWSRISMVSRFFRYVPYPTMPDLSRSLTYPWELPSPNEKERAKCWTENILIYRMILLYMVA